MTDVSLSPRLSLLAMAGPSSRPMAVGRYPSGARVVARWPRVALLAGLWSRTCSVCASTLSKPASNNTTRPDTGPRSARGAPGAWCSWRSDVPHLFRLHAAATPTLLLLPESADAYTTSPRGGSPQHRHPPRIPCIPSPAGRSGRGLAHASKPSTSSPSSSGTRQCASICRRRSL
jgi:hypothetical protein